jgi:hypothetical protein
MTKVRGMKKIDTKVRRRMFSLCDRASRLSMTCDALKSCFSGKVNNALTALHLARLP